MVLPDGRLPSTLGTVGFRVRCYVRARLGQEEGLWKIPLSAAIC